MEYQVSLTTQAAEQFRQIGLYISHVLQSPQTAKHWIDLLYKELSGLRQMPLRYPLTSEEPWRTRGVRRMVVKNFLVYYLVNSTDGMVSVIAVIYGRRDQLAALTDVFPD